MKKYHPFILFCLVINLLFFVYANTRPIQWLQDEMPAYRFFWSMDGVEKLTLHTGFTIEDFKKPFVSRFTVGAFRPRQVSNLVEMVAFKIGQFWGADYFRDYFLIFLHGLNVFLVGLLVRRLSGCVFLGWIAALMALNAGAALATLFFPFRLAKILVVTFFLSGLNLIIAQPQRFDRAKTSRLILFFSILIAGFYTDESSVFVLPLVAVYLWFFQGREVVLSPRLLKYTTVSFVIVISLGILFYFYSQPFDNHNTWHQSYWGNYAKYFFHFSTMKDIGRSWWFFIQRNFGYWEMSVTGAASFLSFGTLVYFAGKSRKISQEYSFAGAVIFIILAKTLLMPHMAVFSYFMPADAVFPSMLYFTFYYVYIESFLFILAIIFLLFSYRENFKILAVLMGCVTVINFSNVVNMPRGVEATLKFHGLDTVERKKGVERARELRKFLSAPHDRPVYLSALSGNQPLIDGRFGFETSWPVYTAYILTMFLPELEKGEIIVSLDNVRPQRVFSSKDELVNANAFYDMASQQFVDLRYLKKTYGVASLKPRAIFAGDGSLVDSRPIEALKGDYIFFVKGLADIRLQLNDQSFDFKQDYGEAYKLIMFELKKDSLDYKLESQLHIRPVLPYTKVDLVGPFFIKK